MYKRKMVVVIAALTLLEASASFAQASCKLSMNDTYDIKNNHGSIVGKLYKGTWASIKGGGPRFQFEREWYEVTMSEQNNKKDWIWRKVNEPAYVDLGWSKNCY